MSHISQNNPSLPLRDAVILGTHDSATSTISESRCCSSLAITTRISLFEQLMGGARYLDIRLGKTGSKAHEVSIWHGPVCGGRFCTSVSNENNAENDPTKFGNGVNRKLQI